MWPLSPTGCVLTFAWDMVRLTLSALFVVSLFDCVFGYIILSLGDDCDDSRMDSGRAFTMVLAHLQCSIFNAMSFIKL